MLDRRVITKAVNQLDNALDQLKKLQISRDNPRAQRLMRDIHSEITELKGKIKYDLMELVVRVAHRYLLSGSEPTDKQVNYALYLLDKAGYSTMREKSGTVEGWLRGMNRVQISNLIDRLKGM